MKKSKIISLHNILLFFLLISLLLPKQINTKYKQGYINLNAKVIDCDKKIIKAKEQIIITDDNFKCKLGYKVKIKGKLIKPEKNRNFNSFNYRNYLYSKKIYYQMKNIKYKYIKKNTNPLYKLKTDLTNHINKKRSKTYMLALILGNKDFTDNIKESYQLNGLSHLFSISGMHITIISTIILKILNKLFSKKISYILTIIILISYTFILMFTPSLVRAVLLFILLTIDKYKKLKIKKEDFLLLIMIFYIINNPYIIYDVGFLFSYIISYSLIKYKQIYIKENYIIKSFRISLISQISSLPIMINTYHYINPLSPFINLLFVPLISLIIYPLCLINLFIPVDNILINLIKIMESMSLSLNNPNILINLRHINIIIIFMYYIVIFYILKTYNKKKILLLGLVILLHHNINYLDPNIYLTMIDVGQGDSFLLQLPYNKGNILIDTGGHINQKTDTAKQNIIPYLREEGINKINYLIITHGDYDHIGGALSLINNYKVDNIYINNEHNNQYEKKLLKKGAINVDYGDLIIDKYKLTFLKRKKQNSENDNSLIIYTRLNNKNILLMGDASSKEEDYILKKYNIKNIDILKVGHHGSKTSSSQKFINQINPKVALISAGKNNLYHHPNKQTLKRLSRSYIYITKNNGAVKINLTNNKINCALQCPLMH